MTDQRPAVRFWLIPGFSQTASAWDSTILALPPACRATTLDIPVGPAFAETAHQLAAGREGIWVGYSLGGRLALQVALDRPQQVAGLVLISTTPGILDPGERSTRRRTDDDLADWTETHGTNAFLDRWLAQPMFAGLNPVQARQHRLTSARAVADQLRMLGQGVQEPLWDRLVELPMPVMLVAGEEDAKYAGIAREMATAIGPTVELRLVPKAGHALLQERPEAIAEILAGL